MIREYSVIVAAFLTGIIGPIIAAWVRSYFEKRSKKDLLVSAIELSGIVEDKIEDIRKDYDADRVWIAQFHNGSHFYPSGKSIAKFSILYETVKEEIASIQGKFQNVPVNLFGKAFNHLLANNTISVKSHKDQAFCGLTYFLEEHSCKSSYVFIIRSIEERFIGFMGMDFALEERELTDEEIVDLEIKASSIGGVLMNHLK